MRCESATRFAFKQRETCGSSERLRSISERLSKRKRQKKLRRPLRPFSAYLKQFICRRADRSDRTGRLKYGQWKHRHDPVPFQGISGDIPVAVTSRLPLKRRRSSDRFSGGRKKLQLKGLRRCEPFWKILNRLAMSSPELRSGVLSLLLIPGLQNPSRNEPLTKRARRHPAAAILVDDEIPFSSDSGGDQSDDPEVFLRSNPWPGSGVE